VRFREFDVEEFDIADAAPGDLRAYYDLAMAHEAENPARRETPSFESFVRREADSGPNTPRRRRLLVRAADGSVVASLSMIFPVRENTHMAAATAVVAESYRRRGIASVLLAQGLVGARADGRTTVAAAAIRSGSPAEAAVTALGFRRTYAYVHQLLEIPAADPASWSAAVPDGFRLEFWDDATPEALLASYARARNVIAHAPAQGTSLRYPEWTPALVREVEEQVRRVGEQRMVLVAVDEASNEVAAVTELGLTSPGAKRVDQRYTTVLPDYRRRGLALCVKSAMMRRLIDHHPHAESVLSGTAADNAGMIAVNEKLGYQNLGTWSMFEAEIADIEDRVSST
jgi:GNAT superfamily N-acetyltransferase